ncbi:MAG: OmpA family protein [Deltaproteobacteria bacterium]|nr:OmpA family protein [Deltaproteobacteria bacterium]MBN2673083.1 OmpA family protein [Deltaproteobacteria bacterium]
MKQYIIMACVLALTVSGCVKKSLFEETSQQLAAVKSELADSQKQTIELADALEQEKAKVAQLEEEIEQLKSALAATEKLLADEKKINADLQNELTSTINDKAKLEASAEELQKAVKELQERKAAAEARVKEFKNLLKKFQALIDAGKLEVKIKNGRMVLVLPTDILFDSGSAELSAEGKTAIMEVAEVLKTIKDKEYQVEGHTDNVPLTSKKKFKNNWELASKRAMVVVDAMMEAGMQGETLSAASYGEYRPVASNKKKDGRAKNRRIDIVIVPDLSTLPGFSELEKAVDGK